MRCEASPGACSGSRAAATSPRAATPSNARAPPVGDAAEQRLFLFDLLDVAPPPDLRALAAAMSPAAREKGSLRALCELATRASAAAPLLLIVEDIHWADAWTLERLAALAVLRGEAAAALGDDDALRRRPDGGIVAHVAAWRTARRRRPRAARAPRSRSGWRCAHRRCRRRWSRAAWSAPKAIRCSCCSCCSTPAKPRRRACRARSRRSSTRGWTGFAGATSSRSRRPSVLGQRFTLEALRHLRRRPGLRLPAAGRAIPRPRRRQRVLVLSCADSRRRLCIVAAQAPAKPARARRRVDDGRDVVLAAEHFDLAQDGRAAVPTWRRATRSTPSSDTRRHSPLSSAASPSPASRRRASRC